MPQIAISSPADGAIVSAGAPLFIYAAAMGQDPFVSAELLIDGMVAGVEAGPSGGITPFDARYTWIPTEPGVHQLIARANDDADNTANSAGVLVVVLPDETIAAAQGAPADGVEPEDMDETTVSGESGGEATAGETASLDGGEGGEGIGNNSLNAIVFPEVPPEAAQPPAPPGPNDSVGASQPWSGAPGNWINSLTAQSKPNAPQLVGAPGQCGANLTIQDKSNDEEGFRVFRLGLNAPGWIEAAQLASQSQNDWITLSDDGVSGPVNYYVSAFNSQGQADSNIVLVNIDPAGCPEPTTEFPVLTVEIGNLILKKPAEQVYCYKSLGSLQWKRLPDFGFLTPGSDGLDLGEAATQYITITDLEGQPLFDTFELRLECWGWNGGALQFLGDFAHTIDLSNPRDARIDLESLSAEVLVVVGSRGDPEFFDPPIDAIPFNDPCIIFTCGEIDPNVIGNLDLKYPIPENAQMPFISAWLTYDPSVCAAHAEKESLNFNHPQLTPVCEPLPGYNVGPEGPDPQPYIVWTTLDNTCSAGFGNDCRSLEWWANYAEARGGGIWWEVKPGDFNFPTIPTIRRTVSRGDYFCPTKVKDYTVTLNVYVSIDNSSVVI